MCMRHRGLHPCELKQSADGGGPPKSCFVIAFASECPSPRRLAAYLVVSCQKASEKMVPVESQLSL